MTNESTNIFQISHATGYGPEDRFTAHLGYLLENVPQVGQAWVDHLLAKSGRTSDRFLGARKHADGDRQDQPDFLIVCEREDILCEHKLDACLGPQQLERYLARAKRKAKATSLAFISSAEAEIPTDVVSDFNYLRPIAERRPYFLWEELYPIVADRSERLCNEFAAYMAEIGLRPVAHPDWSELFRTSRLSKDFAEHWDETERYFQGQDMKTHIGRSNSPGMEVIGALPWLRQFYLKPVRRSAARTASGGGPFITASVCVRAEQGTARAFEGSEFELDGDGSIVSAPGPLAGLKSDSEAIWCREYRKPLDDVVSSDSIEMRRRLLDFARTSFEDARKRGDAVNAIKGIGA